MFQDLLTLPMRRTQDRLRPRRKGVLSKRVALEPLEDRRLLAVIVDTALDVVDIPPTGTIIDLPGPDGVVSLREAVMMMG